MTSGRPARVLVLVDDVSDGAGGAERFAVGLAAAMPRDRFRVSLCATRGVSGSLASALDEAQIPHFGLGRSGRYDLRPFRTLIRFLRRERIELLHTHKFGSNVWGSLFGRLGRVPAIVAQEHTWSWEGQPLRRLLDGQLIGRLADRFVAVSEADRRRMVELEHVPAHKTIAIPTAFVARSEPPGGDVRGELGVPPGAPLIGTVAQLRPQKAVEVLVDAFALLLADHPDAHLVIVGDGPCRADLTTTTRRSPLAGRVHLPGARTDVGAVLDELDVAAMSSDFEGLPLFMFECMAHRTPLVTTAVGGIPDVVDDGINGLLVPRRDPEALASALARVLDQPGLGRRLSEAAAVRLPEYSMERAAERFGSLYEELLYLKRAGPAR